MIEGLDRANKLSDEVQKFIGENFISRNERENRSILEILLYYFIISKESPDYSVILDKESDEIQTFFRQNYISKFNPLKSWLKYSFLFSCIFLRCRKKAGKKNKIVFILKNEKFYKYVLQILTHEKKNIIILAYEDALKRKALADGFEAISLNSFSNKNYTRYMNTKLRGASFAFVEKMILERILRSLKPKKVILVEGNWHLDIIAGIICKKLSIPSICIQHGWNPNLNCQWQNLTYDLMLTWGRYFSDELAAANKNMVIKFQECGSHVLKQHTPNKNKLNSVGICLQYTNHIITESVYSKFLDDIISIRKHCSDLDFIVREHPSRLLNNQEKNDLIKQNFKFSDPYIEPLHNFFDRIEISIAIYSSTILESFAAQVVPIIFNNTSLVRYKPDIERLNVGHEVKNYEDVIAIIDSYRDNDFMKSKREHMRNVLHNMFSSFGAESLENYKMAIFKD